MGHAGAAGLTLLSQGMLLDSLLHLDPQPRGTLAPAPNRRDPGVRPTAPHGPTRSCGSRKPGSPAVSELPRGAALVDNHRAGVKSISNTAGETGCGNY